MVLHRLLQWGGMGGGNFTARGGYRVIDQAEKAAPRSNCHRKPVTYKGRRQNRGLQTSIDDVDVVDSRTGDREVVHDKSDAFNIKTLRPTVN